MKSNERPKYAFCSSGFCPISMEDLHQKNESRCQYYRDTYKGLTVPDRIYKAIKSNEPAFLAPDSDYGCRIIANKTSQTA